MDRRCAGLLLTLALFGAPQAAAPASATTVTGAVVAAGTPSLQAVACASATVCQAVGVDYGPTDLGVVVPITGGTPGVVRPAGPGTLLGVACPGAVTCQAVGLGSPGAIVMAIEDGVPGLARPVAGALSLEGVACPTTTVCVAVGMAASGAGGVVVPIVNGIPGAAVVIPGTRVLHGVACPTPTSCLAVGQSSPSPGAPASGHGVAVALVDGAPGPAQVVPGIFELYGAACPGPTDCVAVGVAPTTPGFAVGAVLAVRDGIPGVAQVVPGTFLLSAVACPGAATCEAVGRAPVSPGVGGPGAPGVVVPISGGRPGHVELVAASTLLGVDCPTATTCQAVGFGPTASSGVVVGINTFTCTRTITGDHVGTLVVRTGSTCLSRAHLTGSVIVRPGAALDIESSTLSGSIRATRPTGLRLCATRTRGSISVGGATGFVLVGDPGDDGCLPNRIGGSLRLSRNVHGLEVVGNTVRGALLASRNAGRGAFPADRAPEVSGNRRLRTTR